MRQEPGKRVCLALVVQKRLVMNLGVAPYLSYR